MMERMMMLNEKNHGKIAFLFIDRTLHVGLNHGKDSFEPPAHKKDDLTEHGEIKRLSGELGVIFDFVETLELEKNVFKE
jgi:hypothetical protein